MISLPQYTARWTLKKEIKLQVFSDLHRLREFTTYTLTERIAKASTSAKGKVKEGRH